MGGTGSKLPASSRFSPGLIYVEIMVDKMTWGQVFLSTAISRQYNSTNAPSLFNYLSLSSVDVIK